MAGLKINKKVAKEVKIDDKDIKIKDNSNSDNSTESDSTDIDINFGELKSSIDEAEEGDNDESFEDVDENSNKKTKIKIIAIGGVVLIFIAVGVVALIGSKGVKNEDMSPVGGVVVDDVMIDDGLGSEEEQTEEDTPTEESQDPSESTSNAASDAKKEDKVVYENAMLGLALKYPSNWYVEERADVLLNMVQSTNVNGDIDLFTNEVKLAGVVMDFSARDELGTKISLGVSPLVITGDTQVADISSLSDIISVGTASQIDEQIKNNIASGGGTLLSSVPSVVKDIGNYKVIQSAYQFEKNGIKMDVIQLLVPYGVNNIVLTGTSKVGSNPINKEEVMINMLGSLGKVGDVELGTEESVEESTVDNAVNNVGNEPKEDGESN